MTVYRYPKAQDAVDWFMEYRRGLGPCEPTLVESVYAQYREWEHRGGYKPVGITAFLAAAKAAGAVVLWRARQRMFANEPVVREPEPVWPKPPKVEPVVRVKRKPSKADIAPLATKLLLVFVQMNTERNARARATLQPLVGELCAGMPQGSFEREWLASEPLGVVAGWLNASGCECRLDGGRWVLVGRGWWRVRPGVQAHEVA